MEKRYERNVPAISEQECRLLRSKRVAVIGCGGIGGYLIELLARLGVGYIRAVDGDVFEESNLNRQLLSEQALLGRSKVKAAEARVQRIDPDIKLEPVSAYIDKDNAVELISDCDLVMDGLDNIYARRILAAACAEADLPCIHGAISGWVAQAAVSMPGDGLIDILYPEVSSIHDRSVLSFVPSLCASVQTALAVKMLLGRPVDTGTLYYFDLLDQDLEKLKLDPGLGK